MVNLVHKIINISDFRDVFAISIHKKTTMTRTCLFKKSYIIVSLMMVG